MTATCTCIDVSDIGKPMVEGPERAWDVKIPTICLEMRTSTDLRDSTLP